MKVSQTDFYNMSQKIVLTSHFYPSCSSKASLSVNGARRDLLITSITLRNAHISKPSLYPNFKASCQRRLHLLEQSAICSSKMYGSLNILDLKFHVAQVSMLLPYWFLGIRPCLHSNGKEETPWLEIPFDRKVYNCLWFFHSSTFGNTRATQILLPFNHGSKLWGEWWRFSLPTSLLET